jgi:hypothetical protein
MNINTKYSCCCSTQDGMHAQTLCELEQASGLVVVCSHLLIRQAGYRRSMPTYSVAHARSRLHVAETS